MCLGGADGALSKGVLWVLSFSLLQGKDGLFSKENSCHDNTPAGQKVNIPVTEFWIFILIFPFFLCLLSFPNRVSITWVTNTIIRLTK